ncbi:hypothetical protein TNCV_3763371 [Trichonephila clavipes]|uniref:DUF5641 domain-containing protein n=1 Tax=Trichonephila clavipes TaxID=2585209 RepID=A0A8X6VVB1_TRICX|nr:hypothetical protein TNCV_3763371 [Trichonephila clavipes]
MVLVKEDNLPPLQWNRGRDVQVFPGDDGAVQVVDVKTQRGQLRQVFFMAIVQCTAGQWVGLQGFELDFWKNFWRREFGEERVFLLVAGK